MNKYASFMYLYTYIHMYMLFQKKGIKFFVVFIFLFFLSQIRKQITKFPSILISLFAFSLFRFITSPLFFFFSLFYVTDISIHVCLSSTCFYKHFVPLNQCPRFLLFVFSNTNVKRIIQLVDKFFKCVFYFHIT